MKTMQSAVWGRGHSFGLLVGLVVGLLAMGRGAAATELFLDAADMRCSLYEEVEEPK